MEEGNKEEKKTTRKKVDSTKEVKKNTKSKEEKTIRNKMVLNNFLIKGFLKV